MLKKSLLLMALMIGFISTLSAEEQEVQNTQQEKKTIELPQWVNHSNTFNLRLARFILDGKIGDFDWRAQIQGTNATGPGQPTVQLVDLYAEWRRYPEFKIRAGQFKRCFTFENPTHPITQGWRGYADVINKLSAFGDRTGERSSGGRDIGMRIGAFGWTGSRGQMVDPNLTDPVTQETKTRSVEKNRYAFSIEYDLNDYTFRAEYVHSQGWGAASPGNNVRAIDYTKGDKADGWYVFGIVPLVKGKLFAKARYQCYRNQKEWATSVNQVECGLNYKFTKNLEIHAEYSHVNDRTLAEGKHNYNLIDVELDFRF